MIALTIVAGAPTECDGGLAECECQADCIEQEPPTLRSLHSGDPSFEGVFGGANTMVER